LIKDVLLNRRQVKKEVFELLDQYEPAELTQKLTVFPQTHVINSLFMALCDVRERVKWHAVSCFGEIVSTMADNNVESARIIMRRFLWTLNDESGGIGWGAPEAMAEVMCRSEVLRKEYIHMLISYTQEDGEELFQDGNYLELPLIQRGLLWGIGTLCYAFPAEMRKRGLDVGLKNYLKSDDWHVQMLALWSLVGLGVTYTSDFVKPFLEDNKSLTLFIDGDFREVKVSEICKQLVS
jgi:hypothetical protein